jgi:hypothetical protein
MTDMCSAMRPSSTRPDEPFAGWRVRTRIAGVTDMAQALSKLTVTKTIDEHFLLHLEDEDGQTMEVEATYEQLDVIIESIEEQLESLDDPDEIDAEEIDVADTDKDDD